MGMEWAWCPVRTRDDECLTEEAGAWPGPATVYSGGEATLVEAAEPPLRERGPVYVGEAVCVLLCPFQTSACLPVSRSGSWPEWPHTPKGSPPQTCPFWPELSTTACSVTSVVSDSLQPYGL